MAAAAPGGVVLSLNVRISTELAISHRGSSSETVGDVLRSVHASSALHGSVELAALIYQGRALPHTATLASLGIPDDAELIYSNPFAMFAPGLQRTAAAALASQENVNLSINEVQRNYPQLLVNNCTSICVRFVINDVESTFVVDTGAEVCVMSESTASELGLATSIDRRFTGVARGVGVNRIIGKIHIASVRFPNKVLPMNFIVVENNCPTLVGINVLRMYRARIDLDRMVLSMDGEEVPILPEAEAQAYLSSVMRPAGQQEPSPAP